MGVFVADVPLSYERCLPRIGPIGPRPDGVGRLEAFDMGLETATAPMTAPEALERSELRVAGRVNRAWLMHDMGLSVPSWMFSEQPTDEEVEGFTDDVCRE